MSLSGLLAGVAAVLPSCSCFRLEAPVVDSRGPPLSPSPPPPERCEPAELELEGAAISGLLGVAGAQAAAIRQSAANDV
jgi:hypothetical protein